LAPTAPNEADLASRRCVFDGVGEQVGDDLVEPEGISVDGHRCQVGLARQPGIMAGPLLGRPGHRRHFGEIQALGPQVQSAA
jgi:hypothetical protein